MVAFGAVFNEICVLALIGGASCILAYPIVILGGHGPPYSAPWLVLC